MRLIDGSALEERCKRQMSDEWNKEASPYSWANAYEQFLTDIENCATIDAVPVLRCRECKYYMKSNEQCELIDTRLNFYSTHKRWTEESFCSWGERKDGDADA